jgi:hypothetical protein
MCLTMIITLSKEDIPNISAIDEAANVGGGLQISRYKGGWFSKPSNIIGLSEVGEGCACSMLSDNADWNCVWDMEPSALSKIIMTLHKIYELCSHEFIFEALWIGDKPELESHVTLEEMIQIVRDNKIGQKTRYYVKH